MNSILTISGADPSGGAGIEADLSTIIMYGLRGRSVATALTAQTYTECRGMFPTDPKVFQAVLAAVQADTPPAAIKIGMLATCEIVQQVAAYLRGVPLIPVVLDTVFAASSGMVLLEDAAFPIFKTELLPLATVVTPNLAEASRLLGWNVTTRDDMQRAAQELYVQLWQKNCGHMVVVKGGHLEGDAVDVAWDGQELVCESAPRIPGRHRGTGCRLASAIACELAHGATLLHSYQRAKQWLSAQLKV